MKAVAFHLLCLSWLLGPPKVPTKVVPTDLILASSPLSRYLGSYRHGDFFSSTVQSIALPGLELDLDLGTWT